MISAVKTMFRLLFFMFYISTSFCAKFYRFGDDVYIFPSIREEQVVNSRSLALQRCENYTSNLVSIRSRNTQLFLMEKLTEAYKEFSEIPESRPFFGAITGGFLNRSENDIWMWPDGFSFFDQIAQRPINGAFNAWIRLWNEPNTTEDADCYQLTMYAMATQLTRAWDWVDLPCNETSNEYYVICSKPLSNFLGITTDQQEYSVNENSSLTLQIRISSDYFPVQLNSTLSPLSIIVPNYEWFSYNIPRVSSNMTGEHSITSLFDDVFVAVTFRLDVQYISTIQVKKIVDDDGILSYLECWTLGYPPPRISWSQFDLCDRENTNMSNNIISVNQQDVIALSNTQHQVSQTVWVRNSSATTFTCTAENSFDRLSNTVTVHNDTFRDALKLSVVVTVYEQNTSVSLNWYHFRKFTNYQLLLLSEYKVEIMPLSGECAPVEKLISYPDASIVVEHLCSEIHYRVKITSSVRTCTIDQREEHELNFYMGQQYYSTQDGLIAGLSCCVIILFTAFVLASYHVYKKKPILSYSVNYRQLLHSQGDYRVNELPGNPGYVAAGDVSATLSRHLANVRSRAATFLRNHVYSDIINVHPSDRTDDGTRRTSSGENPYEVVTTNQVYSFAGEREEIGSNSAEPPPCAYSFATDVEKPKYATVKRKLATDSSENEKRNVPSSQNTFD